VQLVNQKKLAVGKQQETKFLNHKAKQKWIVDYLDSETAVARTQVE